jgi:hypothetical protein
VIATNEEEAMVYTDEWVVAHSTGQPADDQATMFFHSQVFQAKIERLPPEDAFVQNHFIPPIRPLPSFGYKFSPFRIFDGGLLGLHGCEIGILRPQNAGKNDSHNQSRPPPDFLWRIIWPHKRLFAMEGNRA